jgi:hypothetical protein
VKLSGYTDPEDRVIGEPNDTVNPWHPIIRSVLRTCRQGDTSACTDVQVLGHSSSSPLNMEAEGQ